MHHFCTGSELLVAYNTFTSVETNRTEKNVIMKQFDYL